MADNLMHLLGNVQNGDLLCLVNGDMLLETHAKRDDDSSAVLFQTFSGEERILGWADTGVLGTPVTRIQNRTAGVNQVDYPAGSWVWDAEEEAT